jgi:protein-tyrosine-phosphatase
MLNDADLILVMDSANMQQMQQVFPELLARTAMLGLFGAPPRLNIDDPYAASTSETSNICVQIRDAVNGLAAFSNRTSLPTSTEAEAHPVASVSP